MRRSARTDGGGRVPAAAATRRLGVDVEETAHGRIKVRLNGQENTFTRPHHKDVSSKEEIVEIRHFLEAAGVSP